ncbi:MAG: endonuclease/exonuclease/phosphatase family protein [Myxococcales bacterium]|nr:endonuclease/exonuclease/phosphatase family protein [Myxococcales bacterium]
MPILVGMELFRVVTLNLMGTGEPLARRMELVRAGLENLSPDAIALQEVVEADAAPNQAQRLAEALRYACVFERARTPAGQVGEGLALLCRHRILDHRAWPLPSNEGGRILLMTQVETPQGTLRLFNTHLDFRPEHGVVRERQILAIHETVATRPGELPSLLLGDFNATPEHDEIRFLRGRHTLGGRRAYLHDAYARINPREEESGATWSIRNPLTRRWRWLESDRRIDYVFVSSIEPNGRGEVRNCRVVLDQPDDDGQFPSDHFGVLADVQLAPS